jgi:hypothetical protein
MAILGAGSVAADSTSFPMVVFADRIFLGSGRIARAAAGGSGHADFRDCVGRNDIRATSQVQVSRVTGVPW